MRAAIGCTALIAVAFWASGCSECSLLDPTSCNPGLVCETVKGKSHASCVPPVEIVGHVTDARTGEGVSQALIWAASTIGTPVTQVTFSGDDGTFTLRLPVVRENEGGTPTSGQFVLEAGGRGHLPYPASLQQSLPIDISAAHQKGSELPWVIQTDQTELRLLPVPSARANTPAIAGAVGLSVNQLGAVVVAESNGVAAAWSYVDALGQFILFNVPPGSYQLETYSRGVIYDPIGLTVSAGSDISNVGIPVANTGGATITGNVQVPSSSQGTSVALAVASTWDPTLRRGALVPGVRAPDPGQAPNVTSAFTLPGVATGTFVVVAGLENDGLTMPLGTPPFRVTVSGGAASLKPSITLLPDVSLVSPGKGPGIDAAPQTPTFVWQAYPGATSYDLQVIDANGTVLGFHPTLGGGDTQVAYSGPPLTEGALYQWRITALDGSGSALATSEDLEGIFRVK